MRATISVCVLFALAGSICAGDSPVEPVKGPKGGAVVKKPTAMDLIAEDERWQFRPTALKLRPELPNHGHLLKKSLQDCPCPH